MTESDKLYFSIGEVCDLTDLEAHVLRFWESEFKQLEPPKSQGGTRRYRKKDVEIVQRIKHLVYVEKFTLDGARRQLSRPPVVADERELITRELQDLLKLLK